MDMDVDCKALVLCVLFVSRPAALTSGGFLWVWSEAYLLHSCVLTEDVLLHKSEGSVIGCKSLVIPFGARPLPEPRPPRWLARSAFPWWVLCSTSALCPGSAPCSTASETPVVLFHCRPSQSLY